MKKILAVLLAISMIATMAFAASPIVSVDVKADGDIVKAEDVSKAGDVLTFLAEDADSQDAWNPPMWGGTGYDINVVLTTADEKAGATICLYNDYTFNYSTSLWIKPVDMLKLSFFSASEQLYDVPSDSADLLKTAGDYGVTLTPVAGLTIDVVLGQGIGLSGTPTIGGKVAYAIDGVATIVANGNFDKQFGAGVTGLALGPATANAVFMFDNSVMSIYEDVTLALGAVNVREELYVNDLTGTIALPLYVKAWGSAGAISWEVVADWEDVTDAANLTVSPAAYYGGTCGAANWSVGLEVPVEIAAATKVGVAVPYSVSISF